jgi:hypothetical protein
MNEAALVASTGTQQQYPVPGTGIKKHLLAGNI